MVLGIINNMADGKLSENNLIAVMAHLFEREEYVVQLFILSQTL